VAVVVAAVMLSTTIAYQGRSSASVLSIIERGNSLTVSLKQPSTSAAEVAKELRNRGVNATVDTEPAAPPDVGRFLSVNSINGAGFSPIGVGGDTFNAFSLTRTSDMRVRLVLGRSARSTEPYAQAFDSFAPGGRLRCVDVWGLTARTAQPIIQTSFSRVQYENADGQASGNVADADNLVVVGAHELASDWVLVVLSPSPIDKTKFKAPDVTGC
jgi:hypothetical protein